MFSSGCVPADVTPPAVTVPADQTVPAGSTAGAAVTFAASANDAVDGPLTATCNPTSGSTFPIGETTVTCSATDAASNTGSASFKITVEAFIGDGYLVRATSTDSSGNLRVIAELLDTNRDGKPSIGDTARLYEYPRDFTETSYGTFDTTECIFVTVAYNRDPSINVDLLQGYGSASYCSAQWAQQGQFPTTSIETVDNFSMYSNNFSSNDSEQFFADEQLTPYFSTDFLSVFNSVDSIELASYTSPADDAFVDVEFNFSP